MSPKTHCKKKCQFIVLTSSRKLLLYIFYLVLLFFLYFDLLIVVVLNPYTACMIVLDKVVYISQCKQYQWLYEHSYLKILPLKC